MQSLNKAQIIGFLGKDPEIRHTQAGQSVATFSVATSESWNDKQSGERKEKTEWHNVVVWNEGLVKVIEKYLAKGDQVYVEGKLQTRKWQDKEGHDRWSTEIMLAFNGVIQILRCKKFQENRENRESEQGGSSFGSSGTAPAAAAKKDPMNDDIPF